MLRSAMFATRGAALSPISLGAVVELVSAGTAAPLAHAAAGERGQAVTLLVALDLGHNHPHPRLRRYVRAQIRRIEAALGLTDSDEIDAELARAEAVHAL
ncbi:hypothetical protein [Methylopila sp. M107]|uniref:hypothetical protein n=1 Tax=Methylopila sp. M107 TaxID=1101190 RepID=UPI00036DA95E|nr:hypothetical protein [Methylopila sp. M107]